MVVDDLTEVCPTLLYFRLLMLVIINLGLNQVWVQGSWRPYPPISELNAPTAKCKNIG